MTVEATSNISGSSFTTQGSGVSQSTERATEPVTSAPENVNVESADVAVNVNSPNVAPSFIDDSNARMEGEASQAAIREAVKKINTNSNTEAVFGIHDATNRVTIKMIDKKTKEVIKEFPPEKTLDLIAKVWEMAGILVDERG